MADIREKIRKLLALATSPNENEARGAMLKARELMAKNKLSEEDFEDRKQAKLVHVDCNTATWTSDSGNIWMTNLCRILCDAYCCTASWSHERGRRTYVLQITGLEDDADLCKQVVEYAIGFIKSATKALCRRYGSDPKSITQSYATGFIMGLEMAFEDQKEEHAEWGLVLVKPDEVREYEEGLGTREVKTRKSSFNPLAYAQGQMDGAKFNAKKVLQG